MYQDARYICEGNTMYICKCIKMHGIYVKEKLYVYKCIKMHGIYVKGTLYIYKCRKMHGIYMKEKLYVYKCMKDARYVCEGNTICVYIYI